MINRPPGQRIIGEQWSADLSLQSRLLQSKTLITNPSISIIGQANIVPSGERQAVCIGGVMNRVPCHMAAACGGEKRVGIGNGIGPRSNALVRGPDLSHKSLKEAMNNYATNKEGWDALMIRPSKNASRDCHTQSESPGSTRCLVPICTYMNISKTSIVASAEHLSPCKRPCRFSTLR